MGVDCITIGAQQYGKAILDHGGRIRQIKAFTTQFQHCASSCNRSCIIAPHLELRGISQFRKSGICRCNQITTGIGDCAIQIENHRFSRHLDPNWRISARF